MSKREFEHLYKTIERHVVVPFIKRENIELGVVGAAPDLSDSIFACHENSIKTYAEYMGHSFIDYSKTAASYKKSKKTYKKAIDKSDLIIWWCDDKSDISGNMRDIFEYAQKDGIPILTIKDQANEKL